MTFWRRQPKHKHTFTKWELHDGTVTTRRGVVANVTLQDRRCTGCGYYESERI